MADGWTVLSDRVKTLAVDWTAYAALGSFVLYLLGYLTLRFHLTALGIGTDLSVLDEWYLFAGPPPQALSGPPAPFKSRAPQESQTQGNGQLSIASRATKPR